MIAKTIDKDTLQRLYIDEKKSSKTIAKILGVSQPTVLDRLRKYGIKVRDYRLKGKGAKYKAKDGYIVVYYPTYKGANSKGYVREHRLVMEEHLGRMLSDDEEVHHINNDRADNRIENLQLITKSEHGRLHAKEQWANRRPLPQPYERKEQQNDR